jgi:hypothetical protein
MSRLTSGEIPEISNNLKFGFVKRFVGHLDQLQRTGLSRHGEWRTRILIFGSRPVLSQLDRWPIWNDNVIQSLSALK